MASLKKMVTKAVERGKAVLHKNGCGVDISKMNASLLTIEEQGDHGTKAPQDRLRAEIIGWLIKHKGPDVDLGAYHIQIGRSRSSSQCKFVGVTAVQCPQHNRKAVELRVRPDKHVFYWTCSLITESEAEATEILSLARPREMAVVKEAIDSFHSISIEAMSAAPRDKGRKLNETLRETKKVNPIQKSLNDETTLNLLCSHLLALGDGNRQMITKGKIRRALSKALGRMEIAPVEHQHAITVLLEEGILSMAEEDDIYLLTISCNELGQDHENCRKEHARDEIMADLQKIKRQHDEAVRTLDEIDHRRSDHLIWMNGLEQATSQKEAELLAL